MIPARGLDVRLPCPDCHRPITVTGGVFIWHVKVGLGTCPSSGQEPRPTAQYEAVLRVRYPAGSAEGAAQHAEVLARRLSGTGQLATVDAVVTLTDPRGAAHAE